MNAEQARENSLKVTPASKIFKRCLTVIYLKIKSASEDGGRYIHYIVGAKARPEVQKATRLLIAQLEKKDHYEVIKTATHASLWLEIKW